MFRILPILLQYGSRCRGSAFLPPGLLFYIAKASLEFLARRSQCAFGVVLKMATQVHHGEENIAELIGYFLSLAAIYRFFELGQLIVVTPLSMYVLWKTLVAQSKASDGKFSGKILRRT